MLCFWCFLINGSFWKFPQLLASYSCFRWDGSYLGFFWRHIPVFAEMVHTAVSFGVIFLFSLRWFIPRFLPAFRPTATWRKPCKPVSGHVTCLVGLFEGTSLGRRSTAIPIRLRLNLLHDCAFVYSPRLNCLILAKGINSDSVSSSIYCVFAVHSPIFGHIIKTEIQPK